MLFRSIGGKSGWIAIFLLILGGAVYSFRGQISETTPPKPVSLSEVAQPIGDLPNVPEKPTPQEINFDGCPPQGKGGDSELNLLKNRVDKGNYAPVSFDSLTALTWPKTVEQTPMKDWSDSARSFIKQYEGIPISVEGYVISVREGYPTPANCNSSDSSDLDWNISFTKNPRDEHSQVVMVVVTARVRQDHQWTLDLIRSTIFNDHLQTRFSGWLFFNPDHPQDIGQTRATLWEIHPVTQIEVFQNNHWIPLDRLAK